VLDAEVEGLEAQLKACIMASFETRAAAYEEEVRSSDGKATWLTIFRQLRKTNSRTSLRASRCNGRRRGGGMLLTGSLGALTQQ